MSREDYYKQRYLRLKASGHVFPKKRKKLATCHPDRMSVAKGLCSECYANQDKYRDTVLQNKYGITLREYVLLLEKQNGVCAICGNEGLNRLAVDHCHKTGVVRGLLCAQCNHGLGNFKDDPKLLISAIDYLGGFHE